MLPLILHVRVLPAGLPRERQRIRSVGSKEKHAQERAGARCLPPITNVLQRERYKKDLQHLFVLYVLAAPRFSFSYIPMLWMSHLKGIIVKRAPTCGG